MVDPIRGDDQGGEVQQLEVRVGNLLEREGVVDGGDQGRQGEEEEEPGPPGRLQHPAPAAARQVEEDQRQKDGADRLDERAQEGEFQRHEC